MRSLGALSVALHASLLVLLAQGIQKSRDGVYMRPLHRHGPIHRVSPADLHGAPLQEFQVKLFPADG